MTDTPSAENAHISKGDVERVAVAIALADNETASDYGHLSIDHPEVSDWSIHLAFAALRASSASAMRETHRVLAKYQWGEGGEGCPCCAGREEGLRATHGHAPDCEIAAALAAEQEASR